MAHVLILESKFYEEISEMLANGAIKELEQAGISYERISVPGSYELPAALSMAITTGLYDGFILLGCIIRGETTHYDHVCQECARGINELAMQFGLAVGFGVVTAENIKQATVRADITGKNMGGKAAKAALRMIELSDYFASKSVVSLGQDLEDFEYFEGDDE